MFIFKFEDAYKCAVTEQQAKIINSIPIKSRKNAVAVANKAVHKREGSQALAIPMGVYTDSERAALSKYIRLQIFVAVLYKIGLAIEESNQD